MPSSPCAAVRLKLLKSGVFAVPAESPLTSVGEVDMVDYYGKFEVIEA